jgi:hypothetical protein
MSKLGKRVQMLERLTNVLNCGQELSQLYAVQKCEGPIEVVEDALVAEEATLGGHFPQIVLLVDEEIQSQNYVDEGEAK